MKGYQKKVSNIFKELDENLKKPIFSDLSNLIKNKSLKEFLYNFLELYYSKTKPKNFEFVKYNNKIYKFIYIDEISSKLCKNKTIISKKINLLVALGFIEKLNIYDGEVSSNPIIQKSLKTSFQNKKKSVNYFTIPNKYTLKLLKTSNEIASKLYNYKITNKFNEKSSLFAFGEKFTQKIFITKRKKQ